MNRILGINCSRNSLHWSNHGFFLILACCHNRLHKVNFSAQEHYQTRRRYCLTQRDLREPQYSNSNSYCNSIASSLYFRDRQFSTLFDFPTADHSLCSLMNNSFPHSFRYQHIYFGGLQLLSMNLCRPFSFMESLRH